MSMATFPMTRTDSLLIAAVAIGVLLALVGLIDAGDAPLDDATAALVNDQPVTTDELRSLLQRRAREGAPVDQLLRTLDDMIDEELLIQRAQELGILRRDSNVRVAIIQAMEKSILNEERGRPISDEELIAFYRENTALFSEPLTLQLEELVLSDVTEVESVEAALRAGTSVDELAAGLASISMTRLPPVPLSLESLARRYPGEVIARLEEASAGDVLLHESSRGTHLTRVIHRLEASTPDFEEVQLSVLNELQIQRQEAAYDEYLLWLRERAEIRKNERLPP